MEPASNITEIVIPLRKANTLSFVLFVVVLITFGSSFAMIWSPEQLFAAWRLFFSNYITLIVSIVGGMIAHELCHASVWASFASGGFASIRFGFDWRQLAPYVHCREYLRWKPYYWGILAPGVLLGIIPGLVSLFIGSGWLHVFSVFMIAGAAGDFYCAYKLNGLPRSAIVLDHPQHLGFLITL